MKVKAASERAKTKARDKLARMIPFDEWCAARPRTDEEKRMCLSLIESLRATAEGRDPDYEAALRVFDQPAP